MSYNGPYRGDTTGDRPRAGRRRVEVKEVYDTRRTPKTRRYTSNTRQSTGECACAKACASLVALRMRHCDGRRHSLRCWLVAIVPLIREQSALRPWHGNAPPLCCCEGATAGVECGHAEATGCAVRLGGLRTHTPLVGCGARGCLFCADERAIGRTLRRLRALSAVLEDPVLLRIGDFGP